MLMATIGISSDILITRYSRVVSSTIVIYDHLITIGDEVELIWGSKYSKVTLFFFLNRYYTLATVIIDSHVVYSDNLSGTVSTQYYRWATITSLVLAVLSQVILSLRVNALYLNSKIVLAVMTVCFLVTTACSIWLLWSGLLSIVVIPLSIPPKTQFCIPTQVTNFYSVWLPLLAYEVVLCALAISRGLREVASVSPVFSSKRTLLGVLLRDSVLNFVVIGMVYLICILFWILAPPGLLEAPVGFPPVFSCVLSNRAIFNLRQVVKSTQETSIPHCVDIRGTPEESKDPSSGT